MRTRSSRPAAAPPLLPPPLVISTEVLREIVSHCDQPTLATMCGVSFGCLELASRPLYEDIILKDVKSMRRLLRRNKTSSASSPSTRITPYTSLNCIHSITLEHLSSGPLGIDSHREFLPEGSKPLRVPVLALDIDPKACSKLSLDPLLAIFQPTTLVIHYPVPLRSDPAKWPVIRDNSLAIGTPRPLLPPQAPRPCLLPSTVILRGIHLSASQFAHLLGNSLDTTDHPVCIIVDYLDGKEKTKGRLAIGHALGKTYLDLVKAITTSHRAIFEPEKAFKLTQVQLWAWVLSVKTSDTIEEVLGDYRNPYDGADEDMIKKRVKMLAASDGLKKFRRGLGQGVRKGLDWQAVEERGVGETETDEEEMDGWSDDDEEKEFDSASDGEGGLAMWRTVPKKTEDELIAEAWAEQEQEGHSDEDGDLYE